MSLRFYWLGAKSGDHGSGCEDPEREAGVAAGVPRSMKMEESTEPEAEKLGVWEPQQDQRRSEGH